MTQADSVPIRHEDGGEPALAAGDSSADEHDSTEQAHSVLSTSPIAQAALGIVAAGFGVAALIDASGLPMFGKHGVPGPGLFPAALSAAVAALGLALAVVSIVRRVRHGRAPAGQMHGVGREFLRAGSVWVGLTATIAVMGLVGFMPAALLLIAYLVLVIERVRGLKAVLVIVAIPVLAYLLFVLVLGVELPTSVLFEGV
jgi:Tripartite tricarboxylate transporter TctB family